ncbi:MAG: hypothetical protein JWR19_4619 [Pedosphaera sp.]|jgi:cytochrome c oxidase assembly factor CtaG|nr:hypothetical protein [Pedosphaera sp.]
MITGLLGLVSLAFIIVCFIFWIMMLVDCIKNDRLSSNEKIIWVLVILFLHALGALIYFLVGRNKMAT